MHDLAVVRLRVDAQIDRRLRWIAAPPDGRANQMANRIDFALATEHGTRHDAAKHAECVAYFFLGNGVPIRYFELAHARPDDR